jgi:NADPH:quinone reductase-like Zn-dependent oxidoreductase
MQALVLEATAGPESARLVEQERPRPAAGEVCVSLRAASLNHRELWIARGLYPGIVLPTVMGADGAGIVESVGDGVDAALVGREVVLYPGLGWGGSERVPDPGFGLLGMPGPGTIAEAICVPADCAFPKPAHLSFIQAAALPVAALTAYRALAVKARLEPGETVLVTGIGGGVATFGLLFARAFGGIVHVTSGSPEKGEAALRAGAAHAFDYREADWGKALRKASGGIDVVLDGAPASAFAEYGRALKLGARVVLYGSTGGAKFAASAPDLFLRHASIIGTAMGSPADFAAMLDCVAAHRIEPMIDRVFPFGEACEALAYLDGGHGLGKVVIDLGAA